MKCNYLFKGRRLVGSLAMAVVCASGQAGLATADTFLSGFNGDLSSSIGVSWEVFDTDDQTPGDQLWTTQFVSTGVTEGTQALEVTHPADAWQAGLRLNSGALAPLIASHDKLEFDVTASPDATWRGVWVMMQGDGLGWSEGKQTDVIPGQTVHLSIDLSQPNPAVPARNWKASAAASGGTWWQIIIVLMGGDAASLETTTTFDNFRLTTAAPVLSADFDNDGDVDGADLGEWKTAFGTTDVGDANNDGVSDGADFLMWQQQYSPPAVAVAAVPEPGAIVLAALAGTGAWSLRRRAARSTER